MTFKSLIIAAVVTTAVTSVAQAQTVMRPRAPLDSAQVVLRDAALLLRDTLQGVQAGRAHMARDFRDASAPALLSRARQLQDACAASARLLPRTRAVYEAAAGGGRREQRLRTRLFEEMTHLTAALEACERGFGEWVRTRDGEAVRGYGNRDAEAVASAVRSYEARLRPWLESYGVTIRPLGAGESLLRS